MTNVDLGFPHVGGSPQRPGAVPGAPASFHLLAKPAGAICNLDCSYCFFLSKEELYPGSTFRMTDELLREYLRQLLESHRSPEVTVAWQGGEPTLMGLDFFRRAMDLVTELAQPGQRVEHTIQTNGTLITDEWADFLAEHDFLVGISIDGPRAVHDAYRVDKGGKPTYDRVIRGLDRLKAHRVRWNVLTTVHRANEDSGLEVYRFLRDDLGAQFIQFIPIVERPSPGGIPVGDEVTDRSVSPAGYGRFLVEVFEEWVRRDVGDVFVQMFDSTLASFAGAPGSLCVHSETCGTALALEHTGDVYSCDHFVEPDHLLGNIGERHLLELVASPQQRAFGEAKRDSLPAYCRGCDVRFACHGGCPKDRFTLTPDGEPGLHYLCASYQQYFRHVDRPMRVMAAALRSGGDADAVMAWYRRNDERLASP
ncbi:anaerobic sulfatase maturase [Pengzhenrongella phosphoraccumulans]|uniref:anaerobic sulfatase maturase n=1 Tax=Pengzhenrongella phosphoraccumulans TaxID=3114394 RepID=UPI00388FE665